MALSVKVSLILVIFLKKENFRERNKCFKLNVDRNYGVLGYFVVISESFF